MPNKTRKLSFFDLPLAIGGGPTGANIADDITGGAFVLVGPPTGVILTTGVVHANAAPQSYIGITWSPPDTQSPERPDRYTIQVSTSTSFTASGTVTQEIAPADRDNPSAIIEGFQPATVQYVRLRAIVKGYPGSWSSMSPLVAGVNQITTAQDLSAAGQPVSVAAQFIGYGDLLVTFAPPTDANFKDVQIVVRASAGGTIYRTTYSAVGRFLYTVAMNIQDTLGAGDPSLYVELRSRTFNNVLGTVVNTGLVTKSAPSAPNPVNITHSWSAETINNGVAAADWTINWGEQGDAAFFYLSINGQPARRIYATTYTYTWSRNVADNGVNGDPTLTYGVQAVDGLGQGSSTTAGSANNQNPAAPTATLNQGAVSGVKADVTSAPPLDLWRYEYVFKRDGTTVATVYTAAASYTYEMQGPGDGGFHSWTVVIRVEDLFAQFSSTATPAAVAFEGLTLSYLRDGVEYGDSLSTASATLKAQFADGIVDSGGISYNA